MWSLRVWGQVPLPLGRCLYVNVHCSILTQPRAWYLRMTGLQDDDKVLCKQHDSLVISNVKQNYSMRLWSFEHKACTPCDIRQEHVHAYSWWLTAHMCHHIWGGGGGN